MKCNVAAVNHRSIGHMSIRLLVSLLIVGVFFYLLIPHLSAFHHSLSVIGHARWIWLALSGGLLLMTFPAAAGVYRCLAKRPIRFYPTVLIQVASTFVNRIVPGGVGTLSLNYDYLRKLHHNAGQAGSVIAANNAIGFLSNIILLAVALPLAPFHIGHLSLTGITLYYWVVGTVIVAAITVLVWSQHLRKEIYRFIWSVGHNILKYRAHPLRLIGALLISMILTSLYALCLAATAKALGTGINPAQALVIMTLGVTLGTITPTPGGLGGAEAGLFTGCLAYHFAADQALAITLAYRFFTYWLLLPVGGLALYVVQRSGYV